jgi:hypothetical protein
MSGKEIGLGRLFVQEAVKAATWGIIFLIVMGMFFITIKKDVKAAVAFGIDRFVSRVVVTATNPYLIEKSKQLVKEGVEYSVKKAAEEAKGVFGDAPIVIIGNEMFKNQESRKASPGK